MSSNTIQQPPILARHIGRDVEVERVWTHIDSDDRMATAMADIRYEDTGNPATVDLGDLAFVRWAS